MQEWFPLAYLPPQAPSLGATWPDMDFDPRPAIAAVGVPAVAFWGEHEDTVPREVSQQVWRNTGIGAEIVDLPDCGHWPVLGNGRRGSKEWGGDDTPSPDYARTSTDGSQAAPCEPSTCGMTPRQRLTPR